MINIRVFKNVLLHFMMILLGFTLLSSCSTARKNDRGTTTSSETVEEKGKLAVEQTTSDERQAPVIQSELNALFFGNKKTNPGGLNAFSTERLQALEGDLVQSKSPVLRYFLENRAFFDQVEDSGGGFRITANGRRLLPFLKTKPGRKKLFQMDLARVREMTSHPCFAALEDCGEYASDGEENTALLTEWVKKYPEKDFQDDRSRVVRGYLDTLAKYETKFVGKKKARKPNVQAQKAERLFQGHRKRIQALL